MNKSAKSIRPFIGAKDYEVSRNFYMDLGFKETILEPKLSVFVYEGMSFYLQNAYVKDWVDNTMIFLEVDGLDEFWAKISALDLPSKYPNVKFSTIQDLQWGRECFLHDPSGILWHIGMFYH
jgi:hypothetical protein